MGETISVVAADGHRLDGYRAAPSSNPKGGVVVIQEIFGVNDHIRSVCDDYAARGILALAPALYDRQKRNAVFGYTDAERNGVRAMRSAIDWEKLALDVAAAIAALRPLKVGMVGYCLGDSVTWLAACRLGIEAGSCYYPTDIARQYRETPQSPVIMHFAERDHIVSLAIVEKFRSAHPDIPTYLYAAEHGFNCWHRPEENYHAASSKLALERTLALFERYVVQ